MLVLSVHSVPVPVAVSSVPSSVPSSVQLPSVPVTVHSEYRSEYEILTSTVCQLKSQMSDVQKVKKVKSQKTKVKS